MVFNYLHLLKLAKYLQVKATNVYFTIVFGVGLLPYLKLATTGMRRHTLIEHKEAAVICEESGPISLNYNVLLTTLEINVVVNHVVSIITSKSTLTYTNCGKIGHSMETCHNMKREVLIVPTTTIKSTKPVTRHIKSRKIHV
jgi:hypothetical protein